MLEGVFGYQQGTLEFEKEEKEREAAIFAAVPTTVDINIVRPVAFPEVVEQAAAVLVSYGSSDDAFLDILLGVAEPEGKLPFDLVRSDKAAEEQMGDMLFDTVAAVQVRPWIEVRGALQGNLRTQQRQA